MCTQVHLEPKRPRISTYLGESFQLICWIFSEVFWLSEYRILARLTKKWPRAQAPAVQTELLPLPCTPRSNTLSPAYPPGDPTRSLKNRRMPTSWFLSQTRALTVQTTTQPRRKERALAHPMPSRA